MPASNHLVDNTPTATGSTVEKTIGASVRFYPSRAQIVSAPAGSKAAPGQLLDVHRFADTDRGEAVLVCDAVGSFVVRTTDLGVNPAWRGASLVTITVT